MRFKRAVSITTDEFSRVFQLLFYRLIASAVFFSLTFLILHLGLGFILESAEFNTLIDLIPEFFRKLALSLTAGDTAILTEFQGTFHAAFRDFVALLGAHMGGIVGSVVGVCCMYILQRFVTGLAQFTLAAAINDRMATFSHTRFSAAFFKNLGKAALYELVFVPVAFLYDLCSLLASWFLFFYLPSLFPTWGFLAVLLSVALTFAAVVALQALKLTLISAWMPAMIVGGKGVFAAFGESLRCGKDFLHRFANYLVACYLIVFVNVGFAICTFGSGVFFTFPLSFVFLIVMQLVNYYETAGKKYFLARDAIAGVENAQPQAAAAAPAPTEAPEPIETAPEAPEIPQTAAEIPETSQAAPQEAPQARESE